MEIHFSNEELREIVEVYIRSNCALVTEGKRVEVTIDKYGHTLAKAKIEDLEKEAA